MLHKGNVGFERAGLPTKRKKYRRWIITENLKVYGLALPTLLLIFLFNYTTIYGIVIAFQDYVPGDPFFGPNVHWVGLKWFVRFMSSHYFVRLLRNTLILSGYNLAFAFGAPILFALLVDQLRCRKYKKFIQTACYLPHFVSIVVVAGIVIAFLQKDGLLTTLLVKMGFENKNYHQEAGAFRWIYTFTGVWKGFGFGSILYCSVLSSIDTQLYEAARLDGANRGQQVWHITLPGLKYVIALNLITTIGGILGSNTQMIMLLYTPATYDVADVIGTYMYRLGILETQYSYTTAAGLLMGLIGFLLTFTANKVSNKLTGFGLW